MSLEVSDEPLEIIQANECGDDSLTSSRFRRVFRELDDARQFRQTVADALAEMRKFWLARIAAWRKRSDEWQNDPTANPYIERLNALLTACDELDATIAALKLPAATAEGESTP